MWWRSRQCRIPANRTLRRQAVESRKDESSTSPRKAPFRDGAPVFANPAGKDSMHRLIAGVTILEHELSELRLLVERQIGVLLDCPNSALAAHVAEYLEKHELESEAALLERLRGADLAPAILAEFLDGV